MKNDKSLIIAIFIKRLAKFIFMAFWILSLTSLILFLFYHIYTMSVFVFFAVIGLIALVILLFWAFGKAHYYD